jgi:hypothetical protein
MRERSLERSTSIDIPFEMVQDEPATETEPIASAQELDEVDANYYKWMTMMSIWPYM